MTKFCASCRFLLGRREYTESSKDWRCGSPSNVSARRLDLVTGLTVTEYFHASCYDARADEGACGTTGAWHEPYIGLSATTHDLLAELEAS